VSLDFDLFGGGGGGIMMVDARAARP